MRRHPARTVGFALALLVAAMGCGALQAPGPAAQPMPPGAVVASIPVGRGPTMLATNPDGTRVFAASVGLLTIIDAATAAAAGTARIDPYTIGLAVTRDGGRLLLTAVQSARLAVLDAATGAPAPAIGLPSSLHPGGYGRVAVSPDGRTAWVANEDEWVARVDLAAATASQRLLDMRPRDVAVSPDGLTLYLAGCRQYCTTGTLELIDTATQQTRATLSVGGAPYRVALSPDGARAYTTNLGGPSVSVVDLAAGTVQATIPVGVQPLGLAVSPDGARVYVASQVSRMLTVVDAGSNAVVATLQMPGEARDVVLAPDGRRAYVSIASPNVVLVLDTASLAPR